MLAVVASVRRFYPESRIHLFQDGGSVDFSRLCQLPKYGCTFEAGVGENSRWTWMKRMLSGAKFLNTTYLIYLEPDVLVRRRHIAEPQYDAGGIYDNFNPGSKAATVYYVERLGRMRDRCFRLQWGHFGLAGGSCFRTAAILDAFAPENVARIDWEELVKKEGDKALSSDFAMIVVLSARGYVVYPWEEAAQNMDKKAPVEEEARKAYAKALPAFNPSAAFQHNHKEGYRKGVAAAEMRLTGKVHKKSDTACHGCIWYSDIAMMEHTNVVPSVEDPSLKYDPTKSQRDRVPRPADCPSTTPPPWP